MDDLYKLIGDKQDQLRGRPRNWRDDLSDWYGSQVWEDQIFGALLYLGMAMALGPIIVIGAMLFLG